MYAMYEAQGRALAPWRAAAGMTASALRQWTPLGGMPIISSALAAYEVMEDTHLTHARPDWRIGEVTCAGQAVEVRETPVIATPFATLLHFEKSVVLDQPKILVLAPMSGHFATLLRQTVQTLLQDHDVYVTDWRNARDVPVEAGAFGFDEYVEHVITFMREIGPGAHLFAVCQPCVQGLAATAIMAEDQDACAPVSLTLMAGPVDARINPTTVGEFAAEKPLVWFERHMTDRVPGAFEGRGRNVYPGFIQLSSFMSMDARRHVRSHLDLAGYMAKGEHEKAAAIRSFYDEYFAVCDMTAEFYLETVDKVFQRHLLARGELEWRGRKVNPAAITQGALLTIEGERDDICAPGQTMAAQVLCTGLPEANKQRYFQEGAGHYGVFSGRRWKTGIYPVVRDFVARHAAPARKKAA
jgi:poly(3-hydroxybutyrate) depolymerase